MTLTEWHPTANNLRHKAITAVRVRRVHISKDRTARQVHRANIRRRAHTDHHNKGCTTSSLTDSSLTGSSLQGTMTTGEAGGAEPEEESVQD